MIRKTNFKYFSLFLAAGFLLYFSCLNPAPCFARQIERICLTLTQAPHNSQAVTWRGSEVLSNPRVQYIKTGQFHPKANQFLSVPAFQKKVEIPENKNVWHYQAILSDLDADTLYTYRVGDEDNFSEWNQFKTASRDFIPFSFIFLGDLQTQIFSCCSQVVRAAARKVPNSRFILLAGDLVNDGEDDGQWQEFFSAFGWLPRACPIVPVAGNHEYPDPRITPPGQRVLTQLWNAHFLLPANGPKTLEGSSFFFKYQDVFFIILNGNEKLEIQAQWLSELLEKRRPDRIIVAIHQPVYSTSQKRNKTIYQEIFSPIYDKYGVDLVLQGHDHAFSRTFPLKNHKRVVKPLKGTVYLMSIAGPKTYPVSDRYDHLFAKTASGRQWYQSIKVTGKKIVVTSFNLAGKIEDKFEIDTP